MKIADMTGVDTGGQSFKIAKAITQFTEHTSRSFIKQKDYIDFPHDILHGKHDIKFVNEYLATCDIIHCHNKYRRCQGWAAINPKAKLIIHQHGRFAEGHLPDAEKIADEIRQAYRVVSTLNLLNYVDNDFSRWIPAPFDVDYFQRMCNENYIESDNVRICHSPTRRDYKNTDLLIETVARIPELELILCEGMTNEQTLKLKSTCDITFDQMHLCYGNSGLEGMAFGQAVIVAPNDNARGLILENIGYEPYIYATPETLYDILVKLTFDKAYRLHYAALATKYIRDYHDFPVVANKLINIYQNL